MSNGPATKRVEGNPASRTPRDASVGGAPHPAKGEGANKGRGTRFGV